jgi:hypothetical protein
LQDHRALFGAEGPPSFSRLLLPTVVLLFFRALLRIVLAKKKLRKHTRARVILLVIYFKYRPVRTRGGNTHYM